MPDTDDMTVPEPNVANYDGGAEKLDADKPTQNDLDMIDAALDAEERAAEGTESEGGDAYSREVAPAKQEPANRNPDGTFASNDQQQQDIDPEIAAIQMPPNMSEKQQSNWRKLTSKLTESASQAKQYAAEVELLRQRIAEQQQTQQLPEDYNELRQFRAIFDLKNDPGFKQKYDQPISNISEGIYGILRKHKASDEVIKSIQDAGGPGKVSPAWWKRNIIDKLAATDDFVDARRLEGAIASIQDFETARERDLQMATQHQETWMQQRQQEYEQAAERDSNTINDYVEQITKEHPWARYQEIPKGATQEQIAQIEKHNAFVEDLSEKFVSALNPKSAQEKAAIASAAALSHVLVTQLRTEQSMRAEMFKKLDLLQKENSALKRSGKMPKSSVQGQSAPRSSLSDRIKMNSSDAIDIGLDEAGA